MLRTTCADQKEWSRQLLPCVMAYNKRKHLMTKVTPFSLMYGRESRTGLNAEHDLNRRPFDAVTNKITASRNRVEQRRMKKNYEARGRRRADVKSGDLVAWHVQEQRLGKSKKLNAKWKGPFRVIRVKWPKVELEDRNGKKKRSI